MSSEALFQLIELKLESGETIGDDLLTLLQSMKFEVEGSSKKLVFSAVEIQVLTHRGEIVAAMDLLRSLEPEFDPVSFDSLLNQVASAAVAFEDDLRFLDIAFARDDFLASPSIENQVAERLISLGFLERATEVVSSSAIGADLTERRYLRAEIAMLQRKFDAVAAILAGVDSPRAQEIREAIGLKLDTESAIPSPTSNVFTDPLDTETENDAPTLLAAGINPSEQSTTTDRQRPLAQAQELIQESELLRNAFIGTLEALPNLVD